MKLELEEFARERKWNFVANASKSTLCCALCTLGEFGVLTFLALVASYPLHHWKMLFQFCVTRTLWSPKDNQHCPVVWWDHILVMWRTWWLNSLRLGYYPLAIGISILCDAIPSDRPAGRVMRSNRAVNPPSLQLIELIIGPPARL